jgi:hypothetical protein
LVRQREVAGDVKPYLKEWEKRIFLKFLERTVSLPYTWKEYAVQTSAAVPPLDTEPGESSGAIYLADGLMLIGTLLGIYTGSLAISVGLASLQASPLLMLVGAMIPPVVSLVLAQRHLVPAILGTKRPVVSSPRWQYRSHSSFRAA